MKSDNLGTFGFDYAPHTKRLVSASRPTWTDYYTYESGLKDFALSWVDSFTPMAEGRLLGYNYDVLGRLTGSFEGKFETMGYKDYATSYDNADRLTGWNEIDPGEDYGYDQTAYSNWRYDAAGNRLNYQRTHSEDNFFPFRNEYTVNDADQLVRVRPFGAMHVSGAVNEQAKIVTGLSLAPVLTEPDGSFSTWIDTNNPGTASFAVKDFKGNTTNKTADFELDGSLGLGYDFEYDVNGNRTRMVTTEYDGDTTSGITYEWDARNQLVAINMGSHRSEFTYDGMGRRIRIKEIENSVTRWDRFFLWDGLTIIASGVWSSAGINGADFNQGYYSNQATFNGPHYYIKDRLGSVRAVVFDDTVLGSFDYDAYGTPRIEGYNTEEVDFLYTGHFYHRPSGLYLAPYRTYDPQFGRWLSREPLGLDGPNAYHYGFNDPINGFDKTGLEYVPYPHDYPVQYPAPFDTDGDGLWDEEDGMPRDPRLPVTAPNAIPYPTVTPSKRPGRLARIADCQRRCADAALETVNAPSTIVLAISGGSYVVDSLCGSSLTSRLLGNISFVLAGPPALYYQTCSICLVYPDYFSGL